GDPLPPLDLLHGAFLRVRDVEAGEAELIVEGRGWIPDRRRMTVGPALTIAGSPLTVRAAATLIVHWSAAENLPALDRSLGACDEREKAQPRFEISLSACAPPSRPREPVDPRTCAVVRQETFGPELTFGSFTAEDILPGLYRAELRLGKLPPAGATAMVRPLEQRDIRVNAWYVKLYGSVTRGGEPLDQDAAIHFPSGYGFATRETGEYRAALLALLGTDALISVSACGAGRPAIVLADRPARPNSRFDIEIPANELTITVTDTFTREFLGGASVRMSIMSLRFPRREVTSRSLKADDEGRVVATEVPERDIVLTVSHSGYQRQQVPPFSLSSREKKGVEVQLLPLRGSRGRILSSRPFDDGWVLWFSPSGVERERGELAADGTFVYDGSRSPDETMVVVSRSHPLWVTRPPALERRETIALRFPDAAPAREFDVAVTGADPRDSRHIGIAVADVRVPQPAFRFHQTLRGLPALIRGSGPLRIRDLAETGPIEVLLGPTAGEVPGRMAGIDLFALPPFAGVPRRRLTPGATVITFELP
ncbi:MAG TPA: carboxypeptidase-like regulatory domain-containing protein, partial [Longimicrobiaceae bacterium]|nr:carboxypeptidase-like regulatory domain-containing protein [Longimicrobiaceae bacterium]